MRALDIVFISYKESNADKNWLELKARFPRAKRVHGVRGIREAHIAAGILSETDFFFVVDGDNRILSTFHFETPTFALDRESLYVYRCKNPATDLTYGFGAIKIYNKNLCERLKTFKGVDLATSVTDHYVILPVVASQTWFFEKPEEAWRGAFRECAKLSAGIIRNSRQPENRERLAKWSAGNPRIPNNDWLKLGARQGRDFGENFPNELHRLNCFNWLEEFYYEHARD